MPEEFSNSEFKTIDEFIKKTFSLDYECLIYFDYITGKIIKCAIGKLNSVELSFDEEEFDSYHVVSIHNHPNSICSPPSSKNFGILGRDFEDYELIVSRDRLWILKAKGTYLDFLLELNIVSDLLFYSSFESCSNRYNNEKIIDKMMDIMYGNQLSNYINDKNIGNIQLTKKEYVI